MEEKFSISNETKSRIPSVPFLSIKEDILGRNYILSLAFIGPTKMRELNNSYRRKNKPTNVLSFSLSSQSGEVLICPSVLKKQTTKFGRNFRELTGFLFIHGLLHLKGMEHSSKMEGVEEKYDQKYFHRNRHRILNDQSRSGRVSKRRKKS